jgi:hypothetical protein
VKTLNRKIIVITTSIAVMIPIVAYLISLQVYHTNVETDILGDFPRDPGGTSHRPETGKSFEDATTATNEGEPNPEIGDATTRTQTKSTETAPDFDSFAADGEESHAELESTTEQLVSPFGFGPYPQVPPDYPNQDVWNRPKRTWRLGLDDAAIKHELMNRVLIKLWNQGDREWTGAATDGGKVYPYYPNTIYVRWKEDENPDGTVYRYLDSVLGGPEMAEYDGYFSEGRIPLGVLAIEMDDSGIDPYSFLGLR